MTYTIRICKECGQQIHIRRKGSLLNLKNRCVHFDKLTITASALESKVISVDPIPLHAEPTHRYVHYCVIHDVPMIFRQHLRKFTELFYCSKCAILDKLLPKEYIKRWKNKPWNNNWQPGDVKLIVSPDYKTIQKWKGKRR